jgi:hypothetical protein
MSLLVDSPWVDRPSFGPLWAPTGVSVNSTKTCHQLAHTRGVAPAGSPPLHSALPQLLPPPCSSPPLPSPRFLSSPPPPPSPFLLSSSPPVLTSTILQHQEGQQLVQVHRRSTWARHQHPLHRPPHPTTPTPARRPPATPQQWAPCHRRRSSGSSGGSLGGAARGAGHPGGRGRGGRGGAGEGGKVCGGQRFEPQVGRGLEVVHVAQQVDGALQGDARTWGRRTGRGAGRGGATGLRKVVWSAGAC